MEKILHDVAYKLDYFILIFLRVTALVVSSPLFGRRNLPNTLKIGFCLLLTYVVFCAYPQAPAIQYSGVIGFALLCAKELLFGLVLGFVTTMFFSIAQTAGFIMDMQIGFGIVSVLDVQSNISVPVTGNFLYIIMMITFLGINGHHRLIQILEATFINIPAGAVALSPNIAWTALEVFVMAFILAVNVSMPVIAAGLIGEVIMGFIVRTVPQMNVFVVGIPLKIIIGFAALMLVLPVYVIFTETIFKNMFDGISKMFAALAVT